MKKIVFLIIISLLLCGCTKYNVQDDKPQTVPITTPATTPVVTTIATTTTTTTTAKQTTTTTKLTTTAVSQTTPNDTSITYPNGYSFFANDWFYPSDMTLKYDFPAGFLIKGLEDRLGKTGEELGYEGEWCALILSDIILQNDYDIIIAFDPCDLAITLMNNGYADFYCMRQENYDSLVEYGLAATDRVIMTDYKSFKPQRGDIVCYLWSEDTEKYNWSHVGMVAEDYIGGKIMHTIEGNVGKGTDPLEHSVKLKERRFDETAVGFIRITSAPDKETEN